MLIRADWGFDVRGYPLVLFATYEVPTAGVVTHLAHRTPVGVLLKTVSRLRKGTGDMHRPLHWPEVCQAKRSDVALRFVSYQHAAKCATSQPDIQFLVTVGLR